MKCFAEVTHKVVTLGNTNLTNSFLYYLMTSVKHCYKCWYGLEH